jgi:hypothetical protein
MIGGLMDIQTMETLRDVGAYGLMSLALIGGFRGWYIWRWQHDKAIAEKEATIARLLKENMKWEDRTMRLLDVNKRLADLVTL